MLMNISKIKIHCFLIFFGLLSLSVFSQSTEKHLYEPSIDNPFGLPNPNAPEQIKDYAPLIGECNCKSVARNADQTWGDTLQMTWRFKYIMNGHAIQDETLKADGVHSGSIRQFNADSAKWYVHYYAVNSAPTPLPTWEGSQKEDGKIILYRPNTAPNGMPGFYKITFSDMDETGFNWLGAWVDTAETISFPLWKITCEKTSASN